MQRLFDLQQLVCTEALLGQRATVDVRSTQQGVGTDDIVDDVLDLIALIAERRESRSNRLVDDLEVPAAGQFLELHQ